MSTELEFKGYAMTNPSEWKELTLMSFKPKPFAPEDVEIAITHCGVCGSDLHTLSQGWGQSKLPLIVGHEIVGKVTRVGEKVAGIKVGDRVGVGAQDAEYPDGTIAQGGYSTGIRAHERFVFPIPDALESRHAASMLCAGVTVYSPLKVNGAGPGKKVGIMGIGGLGHYAILFAKAMGAEVYAFTRGSSKAEDIKKMGADHIIDTNEGSDTNPFVHALQDYFKPLAGKLDILISTVDTFQPGRPISNLISMLWIHGKFISVGLPDSDNPLPPIHPFDLMFNGCLIGGSHIGSKVEVMEMLQLAAEKGIKPWIQELPMNQAKVAFEGMRSHKVRYRYVLTQDIAPVA
ncbi:NADP-dependent alcohol dehydrogenase 7 [Grifola frondosa]|uniref:NADP-dependent alcohol dehydrogenase 7 n=1 Tax=Grifola frondosa TaxID=5627 RepID=A0A1C7MEM9_GRIFR|nr:NADP-dependent alcohol dehydrogenase 7 [Grifola frondosa]